MNSRPAFPDKAVVITDKNLDLPFWAFRLEEFVEVLFRGRNHIPEEVDILRDLIPKAKSMFKGEDRGTLRRTQSDEIGITADTPVPYRMSDLMRLIDDAMGKLGIAEQRSHLKALKARTYAVTTDPHYQFMFSNTTIEDNLDQVLSLIFRIPAMGRPITAFQLNGIPSEVVNVVVSVLCRMAFDLAVWSESKIKTLVLCEEAHRYIPSNQEHGFAPTRHAIARIAKEGRKYGVSLGIVTQRPGELDETILSQCNTFVAMRLGNEIDQDIMRKAISGASRSFINFLPSLANREAIMFGQGVSTPMRLRFMDIPRHELPANHLMEEVGSKDDNAENTIDLSTVLHSMRFPKAFDAFDPISGNVPLGANVVGEQRSSLENHHTNADIRQSQTSGLFSKSSPLRRDIDTAPINSARSIGSARC
ncbi:MAG: ATP-binding protein [Ahrensia sp.]|nr:ATP-binding protein [Ahrensia sp.]